MTIKKIVKEWTEEFGGFGHEHLVLIESLSDFVGKEMFNITVNQNDIFKEVLDKWQKHPDHTATAKDWRELHYFQIHVWDEINKELKSALLGTDKKEMCKRCHKTKAEALVLDSNPLSVARYLEMKERWDNESICIMCQLKEEQDKEGGEK